MCGRLRRDSDEYEIAMERFSPLEIAANTERIFSQIPTTFNAAPGQHLPVFVQNREGEVTIVYMTWGLRRKWTISDMATPSNARAETITSKPMFRDLIARQRCLIPTSGYYEWQQNGTRRIPFSIRKTDPGTNMMAGLYDAWREPDGRITASYTMITTTPSESIKHIHDRMPVMLEPDDYGTWLDRSVNDMRVVLPLLRPYPSDRLEFWPVSDRINSTRNDGPDLIKPVELVEQPSLLPV